MFKDTSTLFTAHQGCLESQFGGKRYWQSWPAPDARAALVVVHGLAEHGGRYARLAGCLGANGISVFALDHRGHGRSDGKRGAIKDIDQLEGDLDHFVNQVVRPLGLPIYLYGQNLGGTLALAHCLRHPGRIDGLLLSAPFIYAAFLPREMIMVMEGLSTFLPSVPGYRLSPKLLSSDAKEVATFRKDPLNLHDAVPIKSISEILGAMAELRDSVSQLSLPLLVQHGEDDPLVALASSERLIQACSSSDKCLTTYPSLRHDLLSASAEARATVTADILTWLSQQIEHTDNQSAS